MAVTKGKSRRTYRLETDGGTYAIKRGSVGQIQAEYVVIRALAEHGFGSVPAIRAPVIEFARQQWVAYEWVEGPSAKPEGGAALVPPAISLSLGRATAALHSAFGRVTFAPDMIPNVSKRAAQLARSLSVTEGVSPQIRPLLLDASHRVQGALARGRFTRDRLVHGDIRFGNIVFDETGAVKAFLDFEKVAWATPFIDLAVGVRNLYSIEQAPVCSLPLDLSNALVFLDGYEPSLAEIVDRTSWRCLQEELVLAAAYELLFVLQYPFLDPTRAVMLRAVAEAQLEWAVGL
jgi:aminoglycoside phosphotransferase (APT) family kinase protein